MSKNNIFPLTRVERKENFIHNFVKKNILKYLRDHSLENSRKRNFPIAVFADDWIGSSIFVDGIYSKPEIDDIFFICECLGVDFDRSSILDIGANIGNHTLQFSKKFARVHAFEVNPRVQHVLLANTYSVNNITVHCHGLGENTSEYFINEDFFNLGASTVEIAPSDLSTKAVKIIPLDDVARAINDVAVIKVDVEGFEASVLSSGESFLKDSMPIIFLEQLSGEFKPPFRETETLDLLRKLGYEFMLCRPQPGRGLLAKVWTSALSLFGRAKTNRVFEFVKDIQKADYDMIVAVHKYNNPLRGEL